MRRLPYTEENLTAAVFRAANGGGSTELYGPDGVEIVWDQTDPRFTNPLHEMEGFQAILGEGVLNLDGTLVSEVGRRSREHVLAWRNAKRDQLH